MLTVDIHSNKETVKEAMYTLKEHILTAKRDKDKLLCLIVGYGSKGTSHKIKTATIEALDEYLKSSFIKGYLLGENCDIFNSEYHKFIKRDRIPDLYKRSTNKGVIFVAV